MVEQLRRYYNREEEFLSEFSNAGAVAALYLKGEWRPNPNCDESVRDNQRYFLQSGELNWLVFDCASAFDDEHGFSSVQIVLRSAKRLVNLRVRDVGGHLLAEIIVDKQMHGRVAR